MQLKQSLTYDDVLMQPIYSTVKSRQEIDLSVDIGRYPRSLVLKTPFISSPMSTITESAMAIDMALNGGIGIIHRFMTIEKQIEEVKKTKRYLQYIIKNPYTINFDDDIKKYEEYVKNYKVNTFLVVNINNTIVGIISKSDYNFYKLDKQNKTKVSQIMTQILNKTTCLSSEQVLNQSLEDIFNYCLKIMKEYKIKKIPVINNQNTTIEGLITFKNIKHYFENKNLSSVDTKGRLIVGCAVGIKDTELDRVKKLVEEEVDLICVDVANGYNKNVGDFIKQIRTLYPNLVIMAGNVCNKEGYGYLNNLDVDCIRVGIGSGSICSTRLETGIGFGQFSAVNQCFDSIIYNKTNFININTKLNNNAKIISDGGSLGKVGNKCKAIASGSVAVMLGNTLSGCPSTPSITINKNGKKCKYFRGMASTVEYLQNTTDDINQDFHSEGVDGIVEIKGSVEDILKYINGGLKSCLSYLGCYNIEELHKKRFLNLIQFSLLTVNGTKESGIRIN